MTTHAILLSCSNIQSNGALIVAACGKRGKTPLLPCFTPCLTCSHVGALSGMQLQMTLARQKAIQPAHSTYSATQLRQYYSMSANIPRDIKHAHSISHLLLHLLLQVTPDTGLPSCMSTLQPNLELHI